jgi:hypothetical protein
MTPLQVAILLKQLHQTAFIPLLASNFDRPLLLEARLILLVLLLLYTRLSLAVAEVEVTETTLLIKQVVAVELVLLCLAGSQHLQPA